MKSLDRHVRTDDPRCIWVGEAGVRVLLSTPYSFCTFWTSYHAYLCLFKNGKQNKGCSAREMAYPEKGALPLLSQLLELRAASRHAASPEHQGSLGSTVLLPQLHHGPGHCILTCYVPLGPLLSLSEPQLDHLTT